MNSFLIILTIIFVFFVPGFVISFIFFARKTIDTIERLTLSFAFSITVIPLVVFYNNLLGIRITMLFVIIQIILVILTAIEILLYKEIRRK